jgi:hypothetical protein
MPDRKLTQQLFDFDPPHTVESPPAAPTACHEPGEETMSAIDQLVDWLTDPRTGKALTELGEEAVHSQEGAGGEKERLRPPRRRPAGSAGAAEAAAEVLHRPA